MSYVKLFASQSRALPASPQALEGLTLLKMLTQSATEIVGKNLKKGAIVVLESTVYPGVTEEIVKPILEEASGLKCGEDFKIGYSPVMMNTL